MGENLMINKYMYALLLGYVLMRNYPPKFVLSYVKRNPPVVLDIDLWLALTSLRNGSNPLDNTLLQIVIKSIKDMVK
jgi:hypothetical protein